MKYNGISVSQGHWAFVFFLDNVYQKLTYYYTCIYCISSTTNCAITSTAATTKLFDNPEKKQIHDFLSI